MRKFARVLRLISLSILFGGSSAIVFAAIVLVKAATANGIPVAEAAATNAPVFIQFGKVALGASIALLIAEAIDFAKRTNKTKAVLLRYASSFLCIAATMVFALGLVPAMEQLLPILKGSETAHLDFQKLHEMSRMVFGGTILFALISLIIPPLSHRCPGPNAEHCKEARS